MKRAFYLLIPALILASCGGGNNASKNDAELAKLKKQRAAIDEKIKKLEANTNDTTKKPTPVGITVLQPQDFIGYVQVQSQINSDENVNASPQAMGTIKAVMVQAGQNVSKGQVLATLDASTIEQQIGQLAPQLALQKTLYEKQQKLWAQNIGTEVQLMTAKAQYESMLKQKATLEAQRNMYRIVSPISGVVDQVNVKVGDNAAPGMSCFRVVNFSKLKAEANLGENYLGKVHTGDPVVLILPDVNDSINTRLSYVAQAVDPISRAFMVQVRLGNNKKLHPNMSCIMKIENYENKDAIVVPVSVIQNTSEGPMLYVADGNRAKAVQVKTGQNSNGQVEVLSGLSAGDKIITTGFEDIDNGDRITIAQ